MLALISPAKKQNFTVKPAPVATTRPPFPAETAELAAIMAGFDVPALMKTLKISENLAKLNVGRFQNFTLPHDPDNAAPALRVFQGDTYVGLAADRFSPADWQFASDHLAILSGLYGLLKPTDLIQPHRLEMGAPLTTPRGKTLYAFWGQRLAERIIAHLRDHDHPRLINLASREYFKAVPTNHLPLPPLTPVFKEPHGDGYRVVGIKAKKARGAMARFFIQNRLSTPEGLKDFTEYGYRYRPELSDERHWTFVGR